MKEAERRYGGRCLRVVAVAATFGFALSASAATVGGAAQETGSAVKGAAGAAGRTVEHGAEATGHAVKRGAQKTGNVLGIAGENQVTAAEAARYERAEKAEHTMSGTVTKVNHGDGMLHLETKEGMLRLAFAPDQLKGVDDGQQMKVQLGYTPLPIPNEAKTKQGESAQERGSEQGGHWVTGKVANLNRQSGVFDLRGTDVRVHFPPANVSTLKDGDRVAIEVAVAK
jgi:hypothetical protein